MVLLEEIQPLLCDRHEAARLLKVSVSTVGRMLRNGQLPRVQICGHVRIPIDAIRQLVLHPATEVKVGNLEELILKMDESVAGMEQVLVRE